MDLSVIEPLDYEDILARRKEAFVHLWPEEERQYWRDTLILESEPVTKLLEESAYLELLLRARINHAAKVNFLAFAEGADLDRLAEFYDLTRQKGESDKDFKKRLIMRIRASSTAGPLAHYRYHALMAHPSVAEVFITSPRAGLVAIYLLGEDGALDDEAMALARDYLLSDKVRVLTDTLDIHQAVERKITLKAQLVLHKNGDIATLEIIKQHLNNLPFALGQSVSLSFLTAHLMQEGVYSVKLLEPTQDITLKPHEISRFERIELNLTHG